MKWRIRDKPVAIQFENSAYCNNRCVFCPVPGMKRGRGFMSDEIFHKIIKEGKEMGVRRYLPFLNGEPFADPRIWDWLDYMEKEKVWITLYTNATLLDKEGIDRLVKYKYINRINVSVNAATKETYKKITGSDLFDKVVENTEYLISKAPFRVKASIVSVAENYHERGAFRKKWWPHAKLNEFSNWAGAIKNLTSKVMERIPCFQLTDKISILWDGRACLCCFDYEGEVVLGDLHKDSLMDIWNRSKSLRTRHTRLDFDMPLCRDCNVNCIASKRGAKKEYR